MHTSEISFKMFRDILVLTNTIKYLRGMLVFPRVEEMNNVRNFFYRRLLIIYLFTIFTPLAWLAHLVINVRDRTYINTTLNFTWFGSLTGCYYFNLYYLSKLKNTIKLYQSLSDFSLVGIPENFTDASQKLTTISKIRFVGIILAISVIVACPQLEYKECEQNNIVNGWNEVCGLIGGVSVGFDIHTHPKKDIFFVYQSLSAVLVYMTASTISGSVFETVEHLIIRLKHVKSVFIASLSMNTPAKRREAFNKAARYHSQIFNICKCMNKSFSGCMFIHVMLTALILGCTSYRLTKDFSIGLLWFFLAWSESLILVCFTGQRLMEESTDVGMEIYKFHWYNLEVDLQKDLEMVILRSQRPMFLKSGPFGVMSYGTLIMILKTAYSFLTVLNSRSRKHS